MTAKTSRYLPIWLTLATAIACGSAALWLDLNPHVEPDFFFSPEDPQFRESADIERSFPSSSQIIIRAAGPVTSPQYAETLEGLSEQIRALNGVRSIRSILNTPALEDPLWRQLLVSPDTNASYILIEINEEDAANAVDPLTDIAAAAETPTFNLQISGVPYVIELIQRYLFRDLVVFSVAAFAVFGLAIGIVYRRTWIVIGTLATCLVSALATLTVLQIAGLSLGLLTANLVTIVFILTLSHIVFLTSNWRLELAGSDGERSAADRIRAAVRSTRLASFWCMATTSLGFISLLLASARPLRDLGLAGATGTLVAIVAAYTMYPLFLLGMSGPPRGASTQIARWLPVRHGAVWVAGLFLVAISMGSGILRLSTDPNLLTYFQPNGPIRTGLELIDADGGSSPLRVVAQRPDAQPLDDQSGVTLIRAFHDSLTRDESVGSVVSPALLFGEISRSPLAAGRSLEEVLDLPFVQPFVAPFFSRDRTRAHFMLRMHESERLTSRRAVMGRIEETFRRNGLVPVQMGGLYQLQAQLADLVAASLRIALVGLILLFAGIAWLLSRSGRVVAAMTACLVTIPLVVLGSFGHLGIAIDIISSPAANVALAMGVDTMIHLVVRVRRLTTNGLENQEAWLRARAELWHPIVGAGLIIGGGFAIFTLSTFPPTGRFGMAVVLGTLTAVAMALVGLPMLMMGKAPEGRS